METVTGNTSTGGDRPITDLFRGPGRGAAAVFSYGIDAPRFVAGGSHQRSEELGGHGEVLEAWATPSLVYREGF